MKSFLKLVLAMLSALLLFALILLLIVAFSGTAEVPIVRNNSYLVINYGGPLLEYPPVMGLEQRLLRDDVETLHRILDNLTKAAVDDRINGVIFKINGHGAGYGMQAEIREAIQQVQAAGKPVLAFATILTPRSYLLAAACDSIFMPPSGYFNFIGLTTERSYVKGTLDKLGIRANFHRIKDYKSAPERFLRKNMSPAARDMANWLLDERWDYFITTLKTDRGLSEKEIQKAMNQAMLRPEDAQNAGFIDTVCYWPEIENMLKNTDKFRTISSRQYGNIEPDEVGITGENEIAVVHAQGTIAGQKSGTTPMMGVIMGYESVIADLKAAEKAKDVKAIVFRINSGGGDAMTSDLIAHQIELTAQKKPVVVSMVDVAASGGYLIAYRATKLVADETSITGSIGIFSGKFNFKGLYQKIGITKDFATKGPMGLFYSDYF
ncbi:S49 family peptidase, partial [bacterium]|nr:S49 family peptidase [bacterium]